MECPAAVGGGALTNQSINTMQETTFWEYLDLINQADTEGLDAREKEDYQVALIKQALIPLDFEEILDFHRILNDKLYELFLPTLAEVFMVSHRKYEDLKKGDVYISNDGFRDFRAWIIGLGREAFEKFKAYGKEEDFLGYDLNPNHAYRDDLEYIITDLYDFFKKRKRNQSQLSAIYEKKYDFGCDGDYDLDLNDKIDWANIDKKYPTILKRK